MVDVDGDFEEEEHDDEELRGEEGSGAHFILIKILPQLIFNSCTLTQELTDSCPQARLCHLSHRLRTHHNYRYYLNNQDLLIDL